MRAATDLEFSSGVELFEFGLRVFHVTAACRVASRQAATVLVATVSIAAAVPRCL